MPVARLDLPDEWGKASMGPAEIVASLKIDLPAKDIHAWIKGPAVVLDAVAVY